MKTPLPKGIIFNNDLEIKTAQAIDGLFSVQESILDQIGVLIGSFYLVYGILFVLCLCVLYMAVKLRKHL